MDAAELPAPAPLQLLAAFDTTMLGHRRRGWILDPARDGELIHGGGILRPVVLVRGRRPGSGGSRSGAVRGGVVRPAGAEARALDAEVRDVGRFLDIGLQAG